MFFITSVGRVYDVSSKQRSPGPVLVSTSSQASLSELLQLPASHQGRPGRGVDLLRFGSDPLLGLFGLLGYLESKIIYPSSAILFGPVPVACVVTGNFANATTQT